MPRKLGVDVIEERSPRWRRGGLCNGEGGVQFRAQLIVHCPALVLIESTVRLERSRQARDRVARAPLTDLGFTAIQARVIAGRVWTDPVRHALEERRPLPGAGA